MELFNNFSTGLYSLGVSNDNICLDLDFINPHLLKSYSESQIPMIKLAKERVSISSLGTQKLTLTFLKETHMGVPNQFILVLTLPVLFSSCALTPPPSENDELPPARYQGNYAPYSEYPTGDNTLRSESFNGNSYVVQSGDNLYRIAKSHGCDYRQLAECNGLHQSRWDGSKPVYDITPGQRLQLCPPCR